jgi:hypothetical protein
LAALKLALGAPRLLKLRQVRRIPRRVVVLMGDTPPPAKELNAKEPMLFVNHATYAPGMYDWACLANLWVEVLGPPDRKLRQLLGEISDLSGPCFWGELTASQLARMESERDEQGKVLKWVWWWSPAREERRLEWWGSWGSRVRKNRSPAVASAR